MGRPSLYKPGFVEQARKLCQLGATDVEIADFFRIAVSTLGNWKLDHPEFLEALKEGKAEADKRVEESLYHRAVGYSHDAVKIFMPAGADKPVHAPYREHYPPDTTAAIFWLKNRQPERWRDKQIVEHGSTSALSDDELDERIRQLLKATGVGEGADRASGGKARPPGSPKPH